MHDRPVALAEPDEEALGDVRAVVERGKRLFA
jgi:hypothetical protein